jgi:regulator of protease activity HflC (stomatin/prohibitin superfamily)
MSDWDIDGGRNGMSKKLMTKLMFPCICVCLLLAFIAARTVEPAHLGIVSVFGSVSESTLESGLHFVNPLATVIPFNLKTQLLYSEQNVPTQEGLSVELDVSLLYHLNEHTVRELFVTLGVDFEQTLILPELQSAVRGLTSEVSAKALYTSGRSEIRDKLMAELDSKLRPRGIILEDVLLKGIKLPKQLINAIELKAQAEQESVRKLPFLFHSRPLRCFPLMGLLALIRPVWNSCSRKKSKKQIVRR